MDLDIVVDVQLLNQSVDLKFQNIVYSVKTKKKNQKVILDNVSGHFVPGRLTAIMGPSGAGKSSLMNVLSGSRTTGVQGSILVNNEPRNLTAFRRKSSYIPQSFAMLANITIQEALHFAADLKLDATVSNFQKTKITSNIMDILNLRDSKDNMVKHLSGGEKKRLSIGVELITNPQVMFFDEPTSGLDSVSSMQVIDHLKHLAVEGNRVIVCVIHSPNSQILSLFDDMYVMSNGKCFYSGSLAAMVPTFKTFGLECPNYYNRADYALEIASDTDTTEIKKLFESEVGKYCHSVIEDQTISEASKLISTNCFGRISDNHQYPISQLSQLIVLTRRTLLCTYRDINLFYFRFFTQIAIGFLLGLVFYDMGNDGEKVISNASCIFFFLMVIYFCNTFPVILTFPMEAKVFTREHMNNWYSVESYLASKMLAEAPCLLLGPTFFLLIAYYLTGQPMEGHRILQMVILCLLFSMFSQAFGLVAGTLWEPALGVFIVPAASIPLLIFSGFFVRLNELQPFLQPVTYVSVFRFIFEGSMLIIYGSDRAKLDCHVELCYFRSPKKFLKFMQLDEANYTYDVVMLVVSVLVTQLALYCALRFKASRLKF